VGISCGGCVLPLGVIDGGFYSRGRPGARRPVRGQCGGPGGVRRSHRAWRPRGRAGRLSPRLRRAVGRCWREQGGRERAEKKNTGRGPWAHFSSSLHFTRLGSGQRERGSTVASSRSVATVLEQARTVQPTVNSICFDSCLPVFDEMPARDLNLNF
jgi:hypothetical protein